MAAHQALLFVDDDPHIIKSLQRLFGDEDYQIHTADSADKALEILENHRISVVISDQKMPHLTGSHLLEKVREHYPETIRILLTGSDDMRAVISAINHGSIYQYVSKPWVDEDLRIIVKKALDQYDLIQENKRLQEITRQQNEELKNNNSLLEEKVRMRTEQLDNFCQELKRNFLEFMRVFITLISDFDTQMGEHCKRVAVMAKLIGKKESLTEAESERLEIAALLHDIGLIGIPKTALQKPLYLLSEREQNLFQQHPVIGQTTLSSVHSLQEVGSIIRSHHEQCDGQGYPDGLKGEEIPKLARIIRVADEFDHLKQPMTGGKPLSNQQCIDYMRKYRGILLDREAVDCLCVVIQDMQTDTTPKSAEIYLPVAKLQPGMKLSRAIKAKNGALFMQQDTILQEEDITSLTSLKQINAILDQFYIYR